MLKSFIKLAFRNLVKHKLNSIVSIFGLSFGMATFLMILGFIQFENKYDKFHTNVNQIYKVHYIKNNDGHKYERQFTGAPVGETLLAHYPDVEKFVRLTQYFDAKIRYKQVVTKPKNVFFADSSLLNVFDFNLINGDSKSALSSPNKVLISKKEAEKLFGNIDVIGKSIFLYDSQKDSEKELIISGVIDDIPVYSSLKFDYLFSYPTLAQCYGKNYLKRWESVTWTYIKLNPNVSAEELKNKLMDFPKKFMPESNDRPVGMTIFPFEQTYYSKADGVHNGVRGNETFSYILLILSGLVLFISCLNFINLTLARSNERAKEVGIRKTFGSSRRNIISQLLTESFLLSTLSILFAIILVELFTPYFSDLISNFYNFLGGNQNREIVINNYTSLTYWISIFSTIILTSIFTVVYPAIKISNLQITNILTGKSLTGGKNSKSQNLLVAFQFVVTSIILISGLHITKQFEQFVEKDNGFEKKGRVVVPFGSKDKLNKIKLVKSELSKYSYIKNVSTTANLPGIPEANYRYYFTPENKKFGVATYYVGENFLQTMEIKLNEGNYFLENNKDAVIINKRASELHKLELNDNIDLLDSKGNVLESKKIIGIVENFKFRGVIPSKSPLIILLSPKRTYKFVIHFADIAKPKIDDILNSTWKNLFSSKTCYYEFLDDKINSFNSMFFVVNKILTYSSVIVFLLAILGLFAMSHFTIERKTKEIGIRKVVGATRSKIFVNISIPFLKLVLFSFLASVPLSYWILDMIFSNIPNNVGISIYIYAISFVLIFFVTVITIGLKTIKAANLNPITVLRDE